MLFYCRIAGGELQHNPLETVDAGFFSLDAMPQPMHADDRRWIAVAREFHFDGRIEPFFDRI
jgi:hypothetical protein